MFQLRKKLEIQEIQTWTLETLILWCKRYWSTKKMILISKLSTLLMNLRRHTPTRTWTSLNIAPCRRRIPAAKSLNLRGASIQVRKGRWIGTKRESLNPRSMPMLFQMITITAGGPKSRLKMGQRGQTIWFRWTMKSPSLKIYNNYKIWKNSLMKES